MRKPTAAMGKVPLKMLILLTSIVLGFVGYLFLTRSNSVLYRYAEPGDPVKEPAFAIFNPFRDRGPERAAESFLQLLKAGKCEQAMAALPASDDYRVDTCERERKYPLTSWRLRNRTDEPHKVRVYYHVWRGPQGGPYAAVWLTVEKPSGGWKVTDFDRFY